VQVLQIAQANQLSQFGTVSLDGTKIHASASRHSTLSYGHADKLEARLRQEVQGLLALAESADAAERPEGLSVLEELARREVQLKAIAAAKAKIEARAKARHEREQAEFEAKCLVNINHLFGGRQSLIIGVGTCGRRSLRLANRL
jgi:S-adenosylhomocysteine hydrolase